MLGSKIERGEVSAGTKIEQKQYSRDTQSTFVKEAELAPRASDRVVEGLLDFTKTAYEGVQYKRAVDIEEDKLKVNARFKGDPAHKDHEAKTSNGIRLGKVLGSQESVNFHREEVSRYLRMNPEATDAQVAEQTAGMWRKIMGDLGETDPLTVKQVGVLAQDQVQSLYTERAQIRKEHERTIWKQTVENLSRQAAQGYKGNPEALAKTLYNIMETGISPDGEEILLNRKEIEDSIRAMTSAEAEAGNITLLEAQVINGNIKKNSPEYNSAKSQFQSYHVSAVMDAASTGDASVFNRAKQEAIESGALKKDSNSMAQATKYYNKIRIEQDAVEIGEVLHQIETLYRNAPDSGGYERVVSRLKYMEEIYPDLMSHSYVQNFLRKIETIDENAALFSMVEEGTDTGVNPMLTDEQRRGVAKHASEQFIREEVALSQNGVKYRKANGEPLEGRELDLSMRTEVLRKLFDFSKEQSLEIPEIQTMLDHLTKVDPETDSGKFQDFIEVFSAASEHMSKESLMLNGTKKHVAFLDHFNKFKPALGVEGAFRRAQNIYNQPTELTKEQRDINKAVLKEAKTKFFRKGFFKGVANLFTGQETTAKVSQYGVERELEITAMGYILGGSTDPEKIAQYTLEDYAKTNTRLSDGSWIRGNTEQLATALGLTDAEGNIGKDAEQMVDEVLSEYKKTIIDKVDAVSRDEITSVRDFVLDVNPYTGMVSVHDTDGHLGLPIHITELGDTFGSKILTSRTKAAQEAAAAKKAKHEAKAAREANFYQMNR